MNVYIGWSGATGRKVADVLQRWLSAVFGTAMTFQSTADVRPGGEWYSDFHEMLKRSECGVLCVTRDGVQSPWLYYEAGAMSIASKRTIPVLFNVAFSELADPLRNYQCVSANLEGIRKLVLLLNQICRQEEQNHISDLNDTIEYMYPALEVDLNKIRAEQRKDEEENRQNGDRLKREFTELDRKLDSILSTLAVISAQPDARQSGAGVSDAGSRLSPGQ